MLVSPTCPIGGEWDPLPLGGDWRPCVSNDCGFSSFNPWPDQGKVGMSADCATIDEAILSPSKTKLFQQTNILIESRLYLVATLL